MFWHQAPQQKVKYIAFHAFPEDVECILTATTASDLLPSCASAFGMQMVLQDLDASVNSVLSLTPLFFFFSSGCWWVSRPGTLRLAFCLHDCCATAWHLTSRGGAFHQLPQHTGTHNCDQTSVHRNNTLFHVSFRERHHARYHHSFLTLICP